MKSILDKKKAQGFSITTLAILVLAVIVVVVVVLGFTKGWGYIFGKTDVLPTNLEAAAQSCSIASSSNLKTTYCYEFKEVEIAGKDQYMNCEKIIAYAEFDPIEDPCDPDQVSDLAKELCVNQDLDDDDLVNEVTCADLTEVDIPIDGDETPEETK